MKNTPEQILAKVRRHLGLSNNATAEQIIHAIKTIEDIRDGAIAAFQQLYKKKEEQGIEWRIRHPGEGHHITCSSFDEAMDEWFEGFNIPTKVVNGVPEPFEDSYRRVKDYFKNRNRS